MGFLFFANLKTVAGSPRIFSSLFSPIRNRGVFSGHWLEKPL
jgi:hypothetical protein